MNTAYKRAVGRLRQQITEELSREPGKWAGKRRWKSERQRRFVMAKLRRDNNLPYQRSHRLSKSWTTDLVTGTEGGVFTVENDTPYMRFVQGDDAQPMHLDSGWPQEGVIISKYRELAEEILIQTWFTVADIHAGVEQR